MKTNLFNQQVENAARNFKGNGFISMAYISEPSMNKAQKAAICALSGMPDDTPIEKRTRGQFQFGVNYGNAVNNRGEKEQGAPIDFTPAPLRWGSWVEGQVNKLIEHKGELYLRFYGLKNGKVENEFFVGGKPATEQQVALIKQFTERVQVLSQAAAGLTENQVIARTIKIDNIMEISIDGINLKRTAIKAA